MMRILFVLDSVEAPAAANPRLGRRLAAALAAAGQEVHLLELWDGETPPPAAAGLPRHQLAFADERQMNRALENGAKQGSPLLVRLARLAVQPAALAAAFRQLVLHRPRRVTDTRREIERLDRALHFDAVCAVCAPYRAAFALEQAQIGGKKLLWQMDPYAANRSYAAPGGWERERQLLSAMDAVFVMSTAAPDFAPGAPLAGFADKAQVLGLPCLLPAGGEPSPHEGLRCTFVGTFYPGLREPTGALRLFAALNRPDVTLTLAGPGMEPFDTALCRAAMGDRLCIPGPVPADRGRALQKEADVLLNLGNAVDNQIPSKLFEYLGSGKPILHLAASPTDPTLPLLARYPLALTLLPDQWAEEPALHAAAARLDRWLGETAGRRVAFETVAALYPGQLPETVAAQFLAKTEQCVQKGDPRA